MKRCFTLIVILTGLMASAMGLASQVLEEGMDGETVQVLTRRLAELGYIANAVDEYDGSVVSAISDFQTANGLDRTGIADIETQRLMNTVAPVTREQYIASFKDRYAGISYASGSSGDGVRQLQEKLKELEYYDSVCDGKFGEGTRRAVVDYQRANGLEPTGIVDPSMLMRLYEGESVLYGDYIAGNCAIRGDTGAHVKAIQDRLNTLGYYTGEPTGTYGDNTYRAVLRFQDDNGIKQSGNVDVETYQALFSDSAASASDDGSLYPGDSGDQVSSMQLLLKSLGFYDEEPNGEYDINTEIAIRLFRAANGMEIISQATADMLTLLYSGQARSVVSLSEAGHVLDEAALKGIFEEACLQVGIVFPKTGNMYSGFSLVEFVYAGEGIKVELTDDIILQLDGNEAVDDALPGEIIVMTHKNREYMTLSFSISCGDGSIIRMNNSTGEIENVMLEDMQFISADIWKLSNEND